MGIFSTQPTVCRLFHVTGINHHHQINRSPPDIRLHQHVFCTFEAAAQFVL
jgi:hypothetical protein